MLGTQRGPMGYLLSKVWRKRVAYTTQSIHNVFSYISPPLFPTLIYTIWERSYSDLVRGPNQVALPLPHQRFQETVPMRGLHFVLGWQKDRIRIDLPIRISCAWLGTAFVWLCVVLWRGEGGDWGTALAFAQVVAASISIIIVYA